MNQNNMKTQERKIKYEKMFHKIFEWPQNTLNFGETKLLLSSCCQRER